MVNQTDKAINADRPIVQDSERENHVEIIFPNTEESVVLGDDIAMAMFGDIMRIITAEEPGRRYDS